MSTAVQYNLPIKIFILNNEYMGMVGNKFMENIHKYDNELYDILNKEIDREETTLELIASENFTSKAVMEMAGSVMTNKYAEGYPGKRYYGGCEFVDEAENLARERLKKLRGTTAMSKQDGKIVKSYMPYSLRG